MKRKFSVLSSQFSVVLVILCLCLPAIVLAQVPGIINYQGRVSVGGTNFDGTGQFKFALVNTPPGNTTYWSNGVNTVSLTVTKGLYSVLLGDTSIANMTTSIPASVFTNTDVRLRVWFGPTVPTVQQLSPDQRLAAAGYALMAGGLRVSPGNNVGIGTLSPKALLDVPGTVALSSDGANLDGRDLTAFENSGQMLIGWNRSRSFGETDFIANRSVGPLGGFSFYDLANDGTEKQLVYMRGDGNVGIGTNAPVSALHVNGTVTATSFSGSGAGLSGVVPADGSVTSAKIAAGAVGVTAIADGAVSNTKLVNNTVTVTAGTGLTGGGAVALGGSTTLSIPNGGVNNAMLANSAVTVTAGTGLSGGGAVSLGGSVTLNNAGVTSLTGDGTITVSAGTGAVTLHSSATAANTASTLVLRDASRNFAANTATLSGNLALPTTAGSSAGVITIGGTPFLHAYGAYNTFVGLNAGNFTMAGIYNVANGNYALGVNSNGNENTASGYGGLNSNTSGRNNTGNGAWALYHNIAGSYNTAVGDSALGNNTSGSNNTAVGEESLLHNTTGGSNTAVGVSALWNNSTGGNNIALGFYSGINLTAGNNNIDIGNAGVAGEANTIRIGTQGTQTATYLVGNVGIDTSNPDAALSVNGTVDKPGGGSWGTFSDIRLKKNVEPLAGALHRLLELRAVTFEYKDPQAIHELPGVQIGMIAQEVEKVFPDWVDTAPNGMKRLNIHGFEALTVEALREVRSENQRQIQERDARIAELERRLVQMEKQMQAVSHEVRELQAAPQSAANVRSNGGM